MTKSEGHVSKVHRLAFTAGIALFAPPCSKANVHMANTTAATPVLQWGVCPDDWIGSSPDSLGHRLQCAAMPMPLDHVVPDGRMIEVGAVRIRAAMTAQREGVIFFNPGGPGSPPGQMLRSIAGNWSSMRHNHPDEMDRRRLSDHYDLVAVIPRGQIGSTPIRCRTGLPTRFAYLPAHLDDANWALVLDEAQDIVDACSAPEHARYINTEQHVHDMDAFRRAMGVERIHFYGVSHGSMIGAWYASTYPEHLDRMLLDSPFDFTNDYRAAYLASLEAEQRRYMEKIVSPLLREPARYGLGSDAGSVTTSIGQLPGDIRQTLAGRVATPLQLAAALHLASWLRANPLPTLAHLRRIIQSAPLAADVPIASRIRLQATNIAQAMYAETRTYPLFPQGQEGISVRTITPCNDARWSQSEQEIREASRQYAARFFNGDGIETLEELVCLRWGGPSARAPDLATMEGGRPFLLLQSEKDRFTPLFASTRIVERFTRAHMLLVRDSDTHGVFYFSRSPCIQRTAAHYLLTGLLPASRSRIFSCDGTMGHALEAMPGEPDLPFTTPAPVTDPLPVRHDELRR